MGDEKRSYPCLSNQISQSYWQKEKSQRHSEKTLCWKGMMITMTDFLLETIQANKYASDGAHWKSWKKILSI